MLGKISFTEVQEVCDKEMSWILSCIIKNVNDHHYDDARDEVWRGVTVLNLADSLGLLRFEEWKNIRESLMNLSMHITKDEIDYTLCSGRK